jgi:nitrogen PTS system EIIA component
MQLFRASGKINCMDAPIDCRVVEIPEASTGSAESAIRFLVGQLIAGRCLEAANVEPVVHILLKRENFGSTGIGKGLAIPHSCCAYVKQVAVVIGHSKFDISWDSIDGLPVRMVCLILGSHDRLGEYMRALEQFTRKLRSEG